MDDDTDAAFRPLAPRSGRRRLLANAMAGAGQALLSGIALFALYRILLDRLGGEGVGAWSLLLAWFALARLADLGLPGGMVRFGAVAMGAGDSAHATSVIVRGVVVAGLLTAVGALLVAGAVIACAPGFLMRRPEALQLIAWAGLATWLSCLSAAIRAGLDAMQRVDLRHGMLLLQNLLLLGGVVLIVEKDGILGALQAQAFATGAAVAVTAMILVHEMRKRRARSPSPGHDRTFPGLMRALLGYGLPFQVTTICGFLVDPLVKVLLGHFADLSAVAWFEMASRLVGQARAVAISALEALVPHIAAFTPDEQRQRLVEDYRLAFRANLIFTSAGVAMLLANLPLIGHLWIGHQEPAFVNFAALLILGWWVSALAAPAYFVAQGIGVQRWNVLAHATIAVANAALGCLLGLYWGGTGVVCGSVLATVLGNILVISGAHRELLRLGGPPVDLPIPVVHVLALALAALPLVHAWGWSSELMERIAVALLACCAAMAVIIFSGGSLAFLAGLRARISPAREGAGGSAS
jgi:O-antigen/teichoic acid export membrane protein